MMESSLNPLRIRVANRAALNPEGDYVLYWMIAYRRVRHNFSLDRAVEIAKQLNKPLIIFEALRTRYQWASDRIHRFVIDGMVDNAADLEPYRGKGILYYPYVEPMPGAGAGLLEALAKNACAVISDDFPCFFLPRMVTAVAQRLPVRLELIDGNGILPMRAAKQVFTMAFHFRRWLQKNLQPHLATDQFPHATPLARLNLPPLETLPKAIIKRWPAANLVKLSSDPVALAEIPIDHHVRIAPIRGGSSAAEKTLKAFLRSRLTDYGEKRNQPDNDCASGLSPYLHFGHVGVHEVFRAAMEPEDWSLDCLSREVNGKAAGWWGCRPTVESFIDELITWREIGFNFCWQREDYDQYSSLPEWCRKTLAKHASDPRPHLYDVQEFEAAATHDPLWNAAQRQLVREGKIHNYLRMLWGKKMLEWSASPEDALETLIHLNNKYALDGRNPNSYSGIFWCLGRYDRPWAPERPIFGQIRYMSSENTARKVSVKAYLRKFGPDNEGRQRSLVLEG